MSLTELKKLAFWLHVNKITLNVAKTEIIIFKTNNKNYDADLESRLCRKRIHTSPYVKYLGVFIDEISTKLIKSNAMTPRLRHFVNKDILLSVYFAIFQSHLASLSLVWGQATLQYHSLQ